MQNRASDGPRKRLPGLVEKKRGGRDAACRVSAGMGFAIRKGDEASLVSTLRLFDLDFL